ncbi:3-isopropylmalate dehydratase [Eubacterium ramulus]|jgi:3-isopropylmalate/(R)-2-methylmalate dehydratase large subunit|uniref:3-isopropylmalate dehydratase large subunit n=1 Tax=Eubacterium ramulus TaxID=39490 RepID=A0A2V1JU79_EUBRA|nr:3-isopropylmalate dehydratase large subunit [Eubacterium ramulus]PWE87679.1 3-isopropylmalate dehydratase [Eubacterium ramulus]
MGMTMTQKILAAHAGLDSVTAGQLIEAKLDVVMANDITGPMALPIFRQMADKVFDKDKVVLVPDHFTPNKDIKSAINSRSIQDFAKEQGLKWYLVQGKCGVEHAILPEYGIVVAGECIIGADSHTCTYGALGAFSTGVGTTDIATGMATGELWFKVPSAIKFVLTGKPGPYVSGKDVIIHIIGKIGVDGALYKSMEFVGDGIANLTMDDRFTMANMAIEAGAKNGIFIVDDQTRAYMDAHSDKQYTTYEPDEDAQYDQVVEIDLSEVRPTVAFPHLPGNAKTIDEVEAMEPIKIDQVVIGSCTNGRISDMRKAAAILKGHTVHPDVRVMVVPATQEVYKECIKEGLVDIFIDAGCAFNTPSCGPCMGGHMGVMAPGEKCVSTTNRNFVGRMGDVESLIYLASPEVAAASAIAGYIANPEKVGDK